MYSKKFGKYLLFVNPFSDIYSFTSFRKFLDEYQEKRAQVEPHFTRKEFCVQLGLPNTRSYFNDIVRGKRLTAKMARRFIDVLHLDEKEATYFLLLVEFDQATNSENKKRALENLSALNPNPAKVLQSDAYQYYSKWYHSTVFALLDVYEVAEDCSVLEEHIFPKLSLKKIEESLELLKRLGLARKSAKGFYKPTQDRIYSGELSQEELVKQYQLECLELSKLALESGDDSQLMNTMVFSLSQKAKLELDAEVQRFLTNVRKIVASDESAATEVEQLNLHWFSSIRREK